MFGKTTVCGFLGVLGMGMGLVALSPQAAMGQSAGWTCNGVAATLVGTAQADVLVGTAGPDVIVAREGDDVIRSLGGDDLVCAGKGDDIVYGGLGFDILYGAQGNDTIYAANGSGLTSRMDNRGARMFGGADNDTIYGSNRWDRMQGGPGVDQLFGYEARDWVRGGPGNDAVDGGPGIDDLHGGNGRDNIEMTEGDVVRGGAGLDLCRIRGGEPSLFRSCGLNVREPSPRRIVVSEDGIDVTEPDPMFVEESVTIDEAVEALGVNSPCDLYTTSALRTKMTEWSRASGLTGDLPSGLLAPGSEIAFEADVQSPTNCSWFSAAQLWSVEISFQPVSGFTDELQSRGQPVPGIGDGASIAGDIRGFVQVGDLFVSITNLPPHHTQTSNDRAVLLSMLSDVADKLS